MQQIPIGTEFGGYVIGKQLAEGGMGAIYQGFKIGSNDKVAIKIMLANLNSEDNARIRFEREIAMMRALDHPNIVPLYANGEESGMRYFVMKLIMGVSLETVMRRDQFSPLDAWDVLDQVAQALDYAHERNLIHRDIKPANILVESARRTQPFSGHVYLGDFGLSKILGELSLTPVGFSVGTANYVAPEQIMDEPLTPMSDIYSFGVVMYELLCGQLPFQKKDISDLIAQHLEEPPPPLMRWNENFPPAVNAVILRTLAKSPADRYQTAGEFAAAYFAALQEAGEEAATRVYW